MKVHSSLLLALAAICLFASAVAVQDKDCGVNCPDKDIDPTDSNDPSQFKVIEPEKALRGFESWHRGFKYKSGIFRRSSSDNLTPDESKDPIDLSKLTHTPTYLPDRGDDDHPVGDVDDALRGFNEWHKQFWHKTMVETLDSNLPKPSAAPGQTPKATSTPSPAPSTNQGSNQVTVCSGKVCPHANAVCCEGKDFCCPQGYRCSDQTLDSNSTGTIPPCIADSSAKVGPQTSLGGSSSAVVSSSASSSPCSASDNQCQTTSAPAEVQKVDASVTPMPKAPIPGGCCDTCACAQPKPKEEDKSPIVVHIIPKIIFEEAPKEVASTSEESSEDGTPDTKGGVDNPADDSNATENSSESGEESGAEEDSEASAENSDDESSMAVENTEATSEESTEPAGESTTDSTADEGTDEGAADEGAADESATDESAADESTESAASL